MNYKEKIEEIDSQVAELQGLYLHQTGEITGDGSEGWYVKRSEVVTLIQSLKEQAQRDAVTEYRINYEKGVLNAVENTVAKDRVAEIKRDAVEERKKWLGFYREDILNSFIPKCSCGKKATVQTARGKYAQENLHRPCNWGWYCDKCFEKGLRGEEEAMGYYTKEGIKEKQ